MCRLFDCLYCQSIAFLRIDLVPELKGPYLSRQRYGYMQHGIEAINR